MPNMLNLTKEESDKLLNLRKETLATLCLEKTGLNGAEARVALVLDYSGSMSSLYRNGTVQAIIERILPIAMQFDDNGEMEFWIFSNNYYRLPNISLKNYYGYVKREIMDRGYQMGGTYYAPVMRDVANKYMNEDPAPIADYVIFITDGENSDRAESTEVITQNSYLPIFWQFVGCGRESFSFLKKLDEMEGRYIDNANFFSIDNMLDSSDSEIYNKLLAEFPSWLNDPIVVDLIQNKYKGIPRIAGGHTAERKPEKRGFFSRLFG